PARARNKTRLALGSLEDRVTPAQTLAPPTLLDPTAALRVDQVTYLIRGTLQEAAKNGTTVSAFRDTNNNGVYDPGTDALAGSSPQQDPPRPRVARGPGHPGPDPRPADPPRPDRRPPCRSGHVPHPRHASGGRQERDHRLGLPRHQQQRRLRPRHRRPRRL